MHAWMHDHELSMSCESARQSTTTSRRDPSNLGGRTLLPMEDETKARMHRAARPSVGRANEAGRCTSRANAAPNCVHPSSRRAHGYSPALPSSIAPPPSSSSSSWPGLEPGSSPAWAPGPPPPSPMIGPWPNGLGGSSEPAPEDGLCSEFGRGESLLRASVRRANPEPNFGGWQRRSSSARWARPGSRSTR